MIVFFLGLLFVLLFLGIPIGFSLGIISLASLLTINISLKVAVVRIFTAIDSFPIIAVPLFILAGNIFSAGKMAESLINLCDILVGRYRAGLAQINVLASMLFGGITGAAVADVAALGRIEMDIMTKGGYDKEFACSLTAATAIIGPIIPPSIPMIIYAYVEEETSLAGLFLAGIVPGVLMGFLIMVYNYFLAIKRNYPRKTVRYGIKQVFLIIKDSLLILFMPIIILGGIFSGIFTPTEAAGVAVVYGLIVCLLITRTLKIGELPKLLINTGITTGVVLIIIGMAHILGFYLAYEHVPTKVAYFLISLSKDPTVFLSIVVVLFLIVGCFVDPTTATILLVPILKPAVTMFGINPLHFGIVAVLALCIGLLTPPVGIVLYETSSLLDISVEKLVAEIWPLIVIEIAVLLIVTYMPFVALFVPNYFGYQ